MNDEKLQPVCKTCKYREWIYRSCGNKTAPMNRTNSYCGYFLDTGKRREGQPKGNYCPNYAEKTQKKKRVSLWLYDIY